jgi:hypothetical protein
MFKGASMASMVLWTALCLWRLDNDVWRVVISVGGLVMWIFGFASGVEHVITRGMP